MTELQKKTAQAIVNVFETGSARGDYGKITVTKGDSGHLTYGRSQTTLASGNLHVLVKAYTSAQRAKFAKELKPYLRRLEKRALPLDRNNRLHRILRLAGEDPVMVKVQDEFFDRVYWYPSVAAAKNIGVESGLGASVVYDSNVHGSWGKMRDRTIERHGAVQEVGERTWIEHYIDVRRQWLATHRDPLLRGTVYRMDAFRELLGTGKWELALPISVRGVLVDERILDGEAVRASAEEMRDRVLTLQTPRTHGNGVKVLQLALNEAGFSLTVDGVYGPATEAAVRQFQKNSQLVVDGAAGLATRAKLGI